MLQARSRHVDCWSPFRTPDRLPQHFPCNRSHVSLSQEQEPEKVTNWIALGPSEVRMSKPPASAANLDQNGSDRIGDGRTCGPKDLTAPELPPPDLKIADEF